MNRAYVFAMKAHGSQKRASGDPYFGHPIEVAGNPHRPEAGRQTIVTAMLHDMIEDTVATREEIEKLFGKDVARLVEGVTKLCKLEAQSERARRGKPAEIPPGDLQGRPRPAGEARRPSAQHADPPPYPVGGQTPADRPRDDRYLRAAGPAHRHLPDHARCGRLAFGELEPVAYASSRVGLTSWTEQGGGLVSRIIGLQLYLADIAWQPRSSAARSTPISIWRKLAERHDQLRAAVRHHGVSGDRRHVADCYRALGVIHRRWPRVPGRFKDYISTPKRNDYRSLHTSVIDGDKDADRDADPRPRNGPRGGAGLAAHWNYKKNKSYGFDPEAQKEAGGRDPLINLRHLVQVLEHGASDAEELVEHAKLEMYLDQVFVFTPKGQLVQPAPARGHAAGLRLCAAHRPRRHHGRRQDQRPS